MSDLGGTPENPDDVTIEIGGQVMTTAQFNAARYPLLHPNPGPIDTDAETATAPPLHEWMWVNIPVELHSRLRQLAVIAGDPQATAATVITSLIRQADAQRGVYEQSNLVDHARRELAIIGEDEWTTEGVVKIIRAFAEMGHSGGSAFAVIAYLETLLRFQPLTEITDDPDDWIHHGEDVWGESGGIWQCRRNGEAFSRDGGSTYYLLSERSDDEVTPMHTAKSHLPAGDDTVPAEDPG